MLTGSVAAAELLDHMTSLRRGQRVPAADR